MSWGKGWHPCRQKQTRRGGVIFLPFLCGRPLWTSPCGVFLIFSVSILSSLFIKFCNVFSCDVVIFEQSSKSSKYFQMQWRRNSIFWINSFSVLYLWQQLCYQCESVMKWKADGHHRHYHQHSFFKRNCVINAAIQVEVQWMCLSTVL